MKGIYGDNFSVRWSTYLKVPITGEYKFRAMTEDGCALYLNGELLISHYMGSTNGPRDMLADQPEKVIIYYNNHHIESE